MPRTRVDAAPWSPRFDAHARFDGVRSVSALLHRFDSFPSVEALDEALAPRLPPRADAARYRLARSEPAPRRRGAPAPARYDVRIDRDGEIPTRASNWHDLLNAVVWAAFPRAKSRLSARQRRIHEARVRDLAAAQANPHARRRDQDALALLDEGGLLALCADTARDEVTAALHRGDERTLWALESSGAVSVLLFGHALYEHLVHGASSRGAVHVIALDDPPRAVDALRERVDVTLAARLDDERCFAEPGGLPAALVD